MLNRREMIKLGLAASAWAVGRPAACLAGDEATLQNLGSVKGIELGIALSRDQMDNPVLLNFAISNCGLITPGVELKWKRLRPSPDNFNFTDADWMLAFATSHGIKLRGHNLCWNQNYPTWFSTTLNKSNAQKFLTDHIQTVVSRYRGKIDSWDVVNEPIRVADNQANGLTDGIWPRLVGAQYIDICFQAARAADPNALLVLNQDGLELETDFGQKTRNATLQLVTDMVRRGVPIQAVGLESHLNGSISMNSPGRTRFVMAIQELGLQVLVTEMDINDTRITGTPDARQEAVGNDYYDYLVDVLPVSHVKHLIFWSPTNRNNWYDRAALTESNMRRADGGQHYPGLLNSEMQPTHAYWAVQAALRKVPSTE
jgi:endo-1,4-beta-xylanase